MRPQLAKVEGVTLFLQVLQDFRVGGKLSRTEYQYTLQDADLDELNEWAPRMYAKLRSLPLLQDVASDQQTDAPIVSITIDRDTAARFGIQPQLIDDTLYDAIGQRQVTQYFTQLSQYHVILEIDPDAAGRSGDPRQDLCEIAAQWRDGAAVDLREDRHDATRAICRSTIKASFRR